MNPLSASIRAETFHALFVVDLCYSNDWFTSPGQ